MSSEEVPKIPSIELLQNRFLLTSGPKETHVQAKENALKKIKEDSTLSSATLAGPHTMEKRTTF